MSRKDDLENLILTSGGLVNEFKGILARTSDPKEVLRSEHGIREQEKYIKNFFSEYTDICLNMSYAARSDIVEIAIGAGVKIPDSLKIEAKNNLNNPVENKDWSETATSLSSVDTRESKRLEPKQSTGPVLKPFNFGMPSANHTFLNRDDRKWLVDTLTRVLRRKNEDDIEFILRQAELPRGVIEINNRPNPAEIARMLVLRLEDRGALNSNYHSLGALLTELIGDDQLGFESNVGLISLLFGYNLINDRQKIERLSAEYQVPSPLFSSEGMLSLVEQSKSLNHLPPQLRPTNIRQRLESLYNDGIARYVNARFLIKGAEKVRAVCRVELNKQGQGTAFLIGPDLVLTNFHVLHPLNESNWPENQPGKWQFRFGALLNEEGGVDAGRVFKLHQDWNQGFSPMRELDYTLVKLNKPVVDPNIGVQPIALAPNTVEKDDYVNIIQHPLGGDMKVSLRYNQVVAKEEQRIYYLADTEKGSSGSPVFNDNWEIVALHRSGGEKDVDDSFQYQANAGVPITSILERIEDKLNN